MKITNPVIHAKDSLIGYGNITTVQMLILSSINCLNLMSLGKKRVTDTKGRMNNNVFEHLQNKKESCSLSSQYLIIIRLYIPLNNVEELIFNFKYQ